MICWLVLRIGLSIFSLDNLEFRRIRHKQRVSNKINRFYRNVNDLGTLYCIVAIIFVASISHDSQEHGTMYRHAQNNSKKSQTCKFTKLHK